MMGKLKRSLRKPVVRTTLLIFGLCSAALYADSHLKADMDLAIENSICHNQRKQMMEHIIVSDSKFKRVSSKLKVCRIKSHSFSDTPPSVSFRVSFKRTKARF